MSDGEPGVEQRAFAAAFVRFVRGFGLLDSDRTPCGAPMSVAEAHALTVLAGESPISQRDLGQRLHLPKSSTSRLVDALQARGWVHRAGDAADGRVRLLRLTPAGQKAAAEVAGRRAARLAVLLDHIPEVDRPAVIRALTLLEEASRAVPD
jgi:DNA-binding MarR family transcriptional regulator